MKQWYGPLYLFGAFTLAGTSVISAEYLSGKLGTFTITAVSLAFTLIFLLPLCWHDLRKAIQILSRKDLVSLCVQSLIGMFLFRMFLIFGLLNTSAGEAGILTGATPAFTAILARFALKEQTDWVKRLGIFSTVGGVLLVQGLLMPDSSFTMNHFGGNLLVLCAALCESLFNILSRYFVRSSDSDETKSLPPMVQTSIVSGIAMVLCLIPAMFEKPLLHLSEIGYPEWFALIWYGVFVTAFAFIFWYAGIKRCGALTAAAFSGMMPFTSLILSVILLGENVGLQQWIGGALVISGIILIGSSRAEEKAVGRQ